MTDRYYAATRKSYDHHGCTELWKTNDSLQLCADKGDPQGFGLTAYVAIDFVFDDSFLDDQRYESVRRITQDAFRKQWNKSFDALQKAMLHGGEYYIQKDDTGLRARFFRIWCVFRQVYEQYFRFRLSVVNALPQQGHFLVTGCISFTTFRSYEVWDLGYAVLPLQLGTGL